jgi:hypothetical protein
MCAATSDAQHVVMENIDTSQRVQDRRASREHEAENHRLVAPAALTEHGLLEALLHPRGAGQVPDDQLSARREPRMRYLRRNRTPVARRESLARS